MKKSILFTLFALGVSLTTYAQVDTVKYVYCQMEVIEKLNGKAKIVLDFGQSRAIFPKAYTDKITGKVAEFNSPIDALNYMVSEEGWTFVQVFTYLIDTTVIQYEQLYYLLRKPKREIK